MAELEKLNERIAQLTELVKTGSEAIKNMEIALRAAEKERDRLADQRREQEPKFERVEYGHLYHYIGLYSGGSKVCTESEDHTHIDNGYYDNNNYFHTRERAEEVADKINFLLKLERLHDIYCPEYVPDWNNESTWKHSVYFNSKSKQYCYNGTLCGDRICEVYFPTGEIAQKVCDILNAELKEEGNIS